MKEALIELVKILAEVGVFLIIIISVFYAATGTWHIGFAVESESMVPNMQVGDLIFVQASHRTNVTTYEEGIKLDYESFHNYGDVIIYRPNGLSSKTPMIHRAMDWVGKGEVMPGGKPAPHAGYITKGDANNHYDQDPRAFGYEPVEPEWIIAVARARVPYLGYPALMLKKGLYAPWSNSKPWE